MFQKQFKEPKQEVNLTSSSIVSGSSSEERYAEMSNANIEKFSLIMDVGESMVNCGADVRTVEDMLSKLGYAFGAIRMNALVINEEIITSAIFPEQTEVTFTRRILTNGSTDFAKLAELSDLCREACNDNLSFEDFKSRFLNINRRNVSDLSLYAGGILSAGGFAVFFGGSILDGLLAAVFAAIVCALIKYFKPIAPNVIIFNFVTSFAVGLLICVACAYFDSMNLNMVIIGVIMLLIPGVAMTNAMHNLFTGDTLSGITRFVETLLWSLALALGFMLSLWLANQIGLTPKDTPDEIQWSFASMIVATVVSCLGFTLLFNVPLKYAIITTGGGLLTWIVYYELNLQWDNFFAATIVASTIAAVYSEAFAYRLKVPSIIFFIVSVITLVPGRYLYYTMRTAVDELWPDCITYGYKTLLFVAGIAGGILIVSSFIQIYSGAKKQKNYK